MRLILFTQNVFDIVAGHLVDTLNKFNLPDREHEELMAIIGTLRPAIVEVEDGEAREYQTMGGR